ncbi:RNA polymerase II subunit A C-terminal domain phosphatase SSU72 [Klebsormidium nitens]|uniref:RNA polymerase II subunit A C-terminal domain phosphatase SSU72 n=1 Tax=Klebsormidium nitens TaxID=105231 RepID=A0A0U9HJU2_KLENI|nr:RNA polymerase II subunit A C-terminal domain phosphatase SSU72 [Klebsormidium nitens]|eukprot:GAQ81768.1 RNA polymerase II subunit A C-terminal domain phosphatase SSU72 [Klebsormidium nitens]
MAAHALLQKSGLLVNSYGTGSQVKLPGPSQKEPNIYSFGTTYQKMHDELAAQNPSLYRKNGILEMLQRNMAVKGAPQRWQDNHEDGFFDIVLTFEERVFDAVLEDMQSRQSKGQSALVVHLEIRDSHEEAASGAKLALELCQMFEEVEAWEDGVDLVLERFEKRYKRRPIYEVCFF